MNTATLTSHLKLFVPTVALTLGGLLIVHPFEAAAQNEPAKEKKQVSVNVNVEAEGEEAIIKIKKIVDGKEELIEKKVPIDQLEDAMKEFESSHGIKTHVVTGSDDEVIFIEDKKVESQIIKVDEENGEKVMTITTEKDGETETKVLKGAEVDEYLEKEARFKFTGDGEHQNIWIHQGDGGEVIKIDGDVAKAKSMMFVTSDDDIDEEINIEEVDGEKTMTITRTENGEKTVETLKGAEVDEYLKNRENIMVIDSKDPQKFRFHIDSEDGEDAKVMMFKVHSDEEGGEMKDVELDMNIEVEEVEGEEGKKKMIIRTNTNGEEREQVIFLDGEGDGEEQQIKIIKSVQMNMDSEDGSSVSESIVIVKQVVRIEDLDENDPQPARKEAKKELQLETLKFFPNPNDGKFTLEFETEKKGEVELSIHDINGRVVYQKNFSPEGLMTQQVDISKQGAGVYILNLIQGKRGISKKIVIE